MGAPSFKAAEILLVEDNPADVRLTMEVLKDAKLCNNIHVVNDGVQALDFLYCRGEYTSATRPDIILLDLNLPRMDGQEVLSRIKGDDKLKHIPVVVLTTSSAEQDIVKSYALHANCYITKPVDLEQFTKVVTSIEEFWFSIVKLPGM